MANILVRQLDDETISRLKSRAKSKGRSLEAEVREILTRTATFDWAEVFALRDRNGVPGQSSVEMISEDRNR